jgi:hypothetical protein
MMFDRLRPRRLFAHARVGAALAALWGAGCNAKTTQAGGLEMVIATDMATPATFDTVHVDIEQRTAAGGWSPPLLDKFYVIPSEITLPTTISIAAGSSPYQEVLVTVTGLKGGLAGQIFVQRVVQTQVPTDRLAELTMELASVCAGKLDCPMGDSCQPSAHGNVVAGSCGADAIDVSTLGAYSPAAIDAGLPSERDAQAIALLAAADGGSEAAQPPSSDASADVTAPEAAIGADANGATDASPGADSCADACTQGQTRCGSGGVQTCQRQGSCTQWVTTSACGDNQTCTPTATTASCVCNANPCTALGTVCEDAQTLATCARDVDGCFYVASTSPCNAPESCSGMAPSAACSTTCSSSCSAGQTTCISKQKATCAMAPSGCFVYGTPEACGPHQSCTGNAGVAACTCDVDPVCGSAANVCTGASIAADCAQDAQGCFYESGTSSCAGNTPVCVNGACAECSTTTMRCTSDTQMETCGADGQWGPATTCADACIGAIGAVGGRCGGACVPLAKQCMGSGVETCGTDGQWGPVAPCTAAAPTCSQGVCVCPSGDAVSNGVCCPGGQSGCGGTCVDETSDAKNCNGCGIACPYGLCKSSTCAASFFGPGHPNAGTGPPLSLGSSTLLGDQLTSGTSSNLVALGLQTVEAGIGVRLALYSDAGGKPGTLLVATNNLTSVANGATEGAVSPTPVTLGASYWIMMLASNNMHIATEPAMTTWYYQTGVSGALPPTFGASTSLTTNFGDLYFVTAP